LSPPQQVAHYYGVISKDPQILRVFEFLVDNKRTHLQPGFDIVIGYHYPEVIGALQMTAKESLELAKRVVSLGLGIEEYHEQVIRCPFCSSEYTAVRFHCPFCNSTKLIKEVLLEHPGDGTIAPLSSFKKEGVDSIVCPVCKKTLVKDGKDYRTVGVWYSCLSCGKQFDTPKNTSLCLSCTKEFSTQELIISSINKITIDKAILEDFSKRHFVLRPLLKVISDVGYEPMSPGTITGKSGYQHIFSAVGKGDDGKIYAFEIAVGNPQVEESTILNMFAKVLDTQPAKSYMICMPSLNINGKKIADVYGIEVIEGESMAEVSKGLHNAIAGKKPDEGKAPSEGKVEGS